jgi:hypothetical protein
MMVSKDRRWIAAEDWRRSTIEWINTPEWLSTNASVRDLIIMSKISLCKVRNTSGGAVRMKSAGQKASHHTKRMVKKKKKKTLRGIPELTKKIEEVVGLHQNATYLFSVVEKPGNHETTFRYFK